MMAYGELCSVAVVPRDDSAESLFPFDFALIGRPEINIKNVVINVNSLMRSLVVVVLQPFAVDVIKMIQTEVNKVVQTLSFCLSDIALTIRIRLRSTYGSLFGFHALALPKRVKLMAELPVPITDQKCGLNSNILQPHRCVSGLLKHPRIIRIKSWGTRENLPASQVDKYQNEGINSTAPCKNFFAKKITGNQCIHMGIDHILPIPGRVSGGLIWNRIKSFLFKNILNGCAADSDIQVVPCYAVASLRDKPKVCFPFASQAVRFSSPRILE
jgi:hypothetical protein